VNGRCPSQDGPAGFFPINDLHSPRLTATLSSQLRLTRTSQSQSASIKVVRNYRGNLQIRRIVIVDAHDDSRELYAQYFKWVGLHATAVPIAADALRMMSRRALDAVVTCLRLPDMDGFALCDALRAMSRAVRLPVIGVSTCLPDHERAVCDTRFAAVLMKPCLPEDLLDSLRETLAANPPRQL
jgi:CheY-like chemotaxis protein